MIKSIPSSSSVRVISPRALRSLSTVTNNLPLLNTCASVGQFSLISSSGNLRSNNNNAATISGVHQLQAKRYFSYGSMGSRNSSSLTYFQRNDLPTNTIIRFVPQQTAWVVERMGKFHRYE